MTILILPQLATTDKNGVIYVCDTGNNRIQLFDSKGKYLTMFASDTQGKHTLRTPSALAFNSKDELIVADEGNHSFIVY